MVERLFVRLPGDPLYAPETTVPAGAMRELEVPQAVRRFIAQPMFYEEHIPEGQEVVERVLPDGAARLIVHLHDTVSARVVGASAAPVVILQRGHVRGISVTLQPGAANALLGVPADAIAGQDLELGDLWGRAGRELTERLAEAPDGPARAALLFAALQARPGASGTRRGSDAAAARQAIALLAENGGRCTMANLSEATGLGERRLQQLFREHLGLTPRTWMRLARMHHCLRALRAGPTRWAHMAIDAGFADQAHLSNEFRALCGLTPSQFLGIAGSCKTSD